MTTIITTVYHVPQGGQSLNDLASAVAAVPVPPSILNAFGLRVTSDSTVNGSGEVVRTLELSMVPSSSASAVAALNAANEIAAVTVSDAGADYILPPVVRLVGGNPMNNVNPGRYVAKARATLKGVAVSVAAGGSGYHSATTTATPVGGLMPSNPNARPMKLSLTIVGGAITAAALIDAGEGYVSVPDIVIVDADASPGSGGSIVVSMGVGQIDVDFRGQGYESVPDVSLVPAFQVMFSSEESQAAAVADILTTAIRQAVLTTDEAEFPVVS